MLAIGGGGSYSYRSGGGSGHPQFGLLQLSSNEILSLTVGGQGSETKIEINGVERLAAAAGGDGNDAKGKGGDVYSGGGAGFEDRLKRNTGKDGGSDGSDGHSSGRILGGNGCGLTLATLNMTRFLLTPGKAGTGVDSCGGGGGGILVNGKRPKDGRNRYDGEGFGGGRGAKSISYGFSYGRNPDAFEEYSTYSRNMDVIPGCVLIEI